MAQSRGGVQCAAPALQRVGLPGAPAPTLWLGMHRDARSAPRVGAVAAMLADGLRALRPQLAPDD